MTRSNPQETLVPEGEYSVVLVRVEDGHAYGKQRWFTIFRIIDEGPHQGLELIRYYNQSKKPHLPRTHNLFLDHVSLHGTRPPQKLTPAKLFSGCAVRARVVTVRDKRTGRKVEQQPECLHYSKIDGFIKLDTSSQKLVLGGKALRDGSPKVRMKT